MRVILTGGGTGGHIYPALSIAQAIHQARLDGSIDRTAEVIAYIGSAEGLEAKLVPPTGLNFRSVPSRKVRKLLSPDTLLAGVALIRGISGALKILNELKPDVVVGTGGYVAAGVVFAQCLRGGRAVIHEQNVIPGRTNLLLARWVKRIGLSFAGSQRYFPARKSVLVGLPVREAVTKKSDPAEARKALGLDPERFTVVVLGGSQGARAINKVVLEAAPDLVRAKLQFVHQAGDRGFNEVKGYTAPGYILKPFLDEREMALAYSAADLVVCRAGASTVAEVTAVGLPSILIPFPAAYADHQTANARYVVDNGGGVLLTEDRMTPESLTNEIMALVHDMSRRAAMAAKSAELGRPDAGGLMVKLLVDVMRN